MTIGHISSVAKVVSRRSRDAAMISVQLSHHGADCKRFIVVADDKLCCRSLCKLQTAWEHNAGKAGNELAGNWTNCMRTLPAVKSDDGDNYASLSLITRPTAAAL